MIISKKYAQKLIRDNKARKAGTTTHNMIVYRCVDRLDINRVDHYRDYLDNR